MHIKLSDDLIVRRIENELFVYNRERSLIHTFNETGVFMWGLFEKGCSEEEAVDALLSEYETDGDTARSDVLSFVNALRNVGIVD